MATITLPSEVILDVLKFVPYENGTELVLTSKSLAKPLQVQLKEQRIAIVAEIRQLESSDLKEKHREIKSNWDDLVWNEEELCQGAYINTADSILEQTAAMTLFNQRVQRIQADRNATFDQYCAIARKRQPIIDKIEILESKLECRKSKTERIADLKCRQDSYQVAVCAIDRFDLLPLSKPGNKMATIILPSEVIMEVLKFVPYKNATKFALTCNGWVKLLHVLLKEQRIAIVAEIRRLENSDVGEKHREIKSVWDGLIGDEEL